MFRFTLLAGLGHHYPHARNNDAGFEAAPEFWEFFRTHRLPDDRAERRRQLRAAGHVELAVGAGQVHLDRPAGEEQGLGDLAVAQPLGRHRRDAALLRRERVDAADGGAARARSGRSQLVHRPIGLDHRPAPVREVEPFAQRLAGVAAMAAAPQRGAQVDQRPGVRHPQLGAGEDVDRLARQLDHVPARGEQRLHAEGLADRLRRAEPPRDLELLLDQLARPVALTEAGRGERRVAAPHQRHRVHVGDGQRAPAGLLEVGSGRRSDRPSAARAGRGRPAPGRCSASAAARRSATRRAAAPRPARARRARCGRR